MATEKGKYAERLVQQWLDKTSAAHSSFAYHRFPDARAAGGRLAAQPSDFLVINTGTPVFLEVKETSELNRLARSKISQYGSLYKMYLARAQVVVIVYRSAYKDWAMVPGKSLFPDSGEAPTSFPFTQFTIFPDVGSALEDMRMFT